MRQEENHREDSQQVIGSPAAAGKSWRHGDTTRPSASQSVHATTPEYMCCSDHHHSPCPCTAPPPPPEHAKVPPHLRRHLGPSGAGVHGGGGAPPPVISGSDISFCITPPLCPTAAALGHKAASEPEQCNTPPYCAPRVDTPRISHTNVRNYYGPYAHCSLDSDKGVACAQHIQLPTHTCTCAWYECTLTSAHISKCMQTQESLGNIKISGSHPCWHKQ